MPDPRLRLRALLVLVLASLLAVGAIALRMRLDRGAQDPYNRTVGPAKLLDVIRRVGPGRLGICLCRPVADLRLTSEDGLTTAASLYAPDAAEPRGGVVVVHGNTALGRRLATYRVLASGLSQRGWTVLTLDLPGFGESDDPLAAGPRPAGYEERMIAAAVRHLIGARGVRPAEVTVIGHSRGTAPALRAALATPEVGRLVLIGGRRRWAERLDDPERREYFWTRATETHRFVYGHPFPAWYSLDDWVRDAAFDYADYDARFTREGHPPVLLIDGEREAEADKRYFEALLARWAEPKARVRLAGSDHYGNMAQSLGVILYDRGVADQLVDALSRWMSGEDPNPG